MSYTAQDHLRPVPPFDFARSLDFVTDSTFAWREQTVTGANLTKAAGIGLQAVVRWLAAKGDAPGRGCCMATTRPRCGMPNSSSCGGRSQPSTTQSVFRRWWYLILTCFTGAGD